jgi:hypothetical protein
MHTDFVIDQFVGNIIRSGLCNKTLNAEIEYKRGQFNSYIDVIYPDLDVNVLMMLTKWYITGFL